MRIPGAVGIVVLVGVLAGDAAAGDITGTVRIAGSRDASNVVVYIDSIPGRTFAPRAARAVIDQSKMTFVPHVLPILVGTTVDFPNNDVVRHNVFSPSKTKRFNLGTYPAGVVKSVTFDKPGKVALLCHVHAEMSAFILVLETPYFTVTGKGGRYSLAGIPAGTYRLSAWHEAMKQRTRGVEVSREGHLTVDFELKE